MMLDYNTPPEQTSKPGPEPVVVTVKEPVQDPGEDCAVVVGGRLLLSLRGGLAQARRREGKETVKRHSGVTGTTGCQT